MTDDLPIEIDDDFSPEDDDGATIWHWLLAAGGVVAAIYILAFIFNFLVGLVGYALQAAVVLLVLYAGYRGLNYLLSDDTSSERQTTLPEDVDVQRELEDLDASAEPDVQLDDVSVDMGEEDELEQKFAELERQFSDE